MFFEADICRYISLRNNNVNVTSQWLQGYAVVWSLQQGSPLFYSNGHTKEASLANHVGTLYIFHIKSIEFFKFSFS